MAEQAVEAGPVVLQPCSVAAHAETHFRVLAGDTQVVHKTDEVGVGPIVKHNKAGIYREHLPLCLYVDGVGVAAKVVLLFKQRDIVFLLQQVGCGQA